MRSRSIRIRQSRWSCRRSAKELRMWRLSGSFRSSITTKTRCHPERCEGPAVAFCNVRIEEIRERSTDLRHNQPMYRDLCALALFLNLIACISAQGIPKELRGEWRVQRILPVRLKFPGTKYLSKTGILLSFQSAV